MRILLPALLALACSDPAEIAPPDATPQPNSDAQEPTQYCERYQQAPAPCYDEECLEGERECGSERICQDWDDCEAPGYDAGPSECFQCRALHWCHCR